LLPGLLAEEQIAFDKLSQLKERLSPTLEISELSFDLYPNPTTNKLFINLPNQESVLYQILNSKGQLLVEDHSLGSTEIDISSLEQGSYFFVVPKLGVRSFIKLD